MRKKIVFIVISILLSSYIKAQKTETIKIESGEVYKKYKGDKLDSLVVSMYAMNYGIYLVFTKTDKEIIGKSIDDKNALLKFGVKNGKQFRTFFYKNQQIISVETIDFAIDNLPKNARITGGYFANSFFYNVVVSNYEKLGEDNPDKSLKLFHRLNIDPKLNSLDSIFDNIAQFFSQEDALFRIYKGSYAEEVQPKVTTWVKTDSQGRITDGIIWKSESKDLKTGKYDIYKLGKIIKTGSESLENFQKTFEKFMNEFDEG